VERGGKGEEKKRKKGEVRRLRSFAYLHHPFNIKGRRVNWSPEEKGEGRGKTGKRNSEHDPRGSFLFLFPFVAATAMDSAPSKPKGKEEGEGGGETLVYLSLTDLPLGGADTAACRFEEKERGGKKRNRALVLSLFSFTFDCTLERSDGWEQRLRRQKKR